MQFRQFLAIGTSLAFLASCGGSYSVSYRLDFDVEDPGTVEQLTEATDRVIKRRLDHLGSAKADTVVTQNAEGATVDVTVDSSEIADMLTSELTAPFDLEIMIATEGDGDIEVEGQGSFVKTGLTGESIRNVIPQIDAETNLSTILIFFTDEGEILLKSLFQKNVQKNLGLFVRGQLVSLLTIEDANVASPLPISGVPSFELANIFADDVNIGIHVTVTRL